LEPIIEELRRGVLAAGDLRARLGGVSRPTLMRAVRAAGEDVVRIGRGPTVQYGLRQDWQGLGGSRFPLIRITAAGIPVAAGELITLAARQSVWLPLGTVSNGLPIALADARPSGFLGRHFAATHADLLLPLRLDDWSDHHVLLAMARRGEDLPGNLIVGDESFERWQALATPERSREDYPQLAEATVAGHPPGSSAGGERPKFGAFVEGRHRLVKFAARPTAADRVARRWCDLLILESLALAAAASAGLDVARTRIVESPTHWFLESERFDRAGVGGRIAVLSLAAVQTNLADSWTRAAVSLRQAGRVTEDDARRLRWLDAFGALIANGDRHPHNVLFFTDEAHTRLQLAPAFDQVSMFYAPTPDGQVPDREFRMPPLSADALDVWDDARAAARRFWADAAEDARLSDGMRRICADNARVVATEPR
jgi:hypothetical protein